MVYSGCLLINDKATRCKDHTISLFIKNLLFVLNRLVERGRLLIVYKPADLGVYVYDLRMALMLWLPL